jgi:hypothetical protein
MNRIHLIRLRSLVRALNIELMRLEWEVADADEPDETDFSFDLHPEDAHVDDDDLPDETDFGPVGPLCVECGNYGQSCVC